MSQNRIKNWKSTNSGTINEKLRQRTSRLEKEEEQRRLLDLEFKRDADKRREETIERAKRLQFYETDLVKNLHSEISALLTFEVELG